MNSLLDILGASVIGAMVVLVMLNLNIYSSQQFFASGSNLRLQQNAKTLADIIDHDIRKVGYKYNGNCIISAQKDKFSFYSDIDSNGVMDVVTLALSDTSSIVTPTNPNQKVLYRIVNGDTSKGPSLDLTNLKFTYRNEFGKSTTNLDSVKYIQTEIWLESKEKVDNQYAKTYWEVTINPRNL